MGVRQNTGAVQHEADHGIATFKRCKWEHNLIFVIVSIEMRSLGTNFKGARHWLQVPLAKVCRLFGTCALKYRLLNLCDALLRFGNESAGRVCAPAVHLVRRMFSSSESNQVRTAGFGLRS